MAAAAAADPSFSWRILRRSGISALCAGSSGLLLVFGRCRIGEELVLDARALAELAIFFLTFLAGQLMAFYSLLLAKGVVPAVSAGLARKLSYIPIAAFLLAIAIHVPLASGTGSTLLFVEMVGNGRAVGPQEAEAAGGEPEGHHGAGVAGDHGGVGVDEQAELMFQQVKENKSSSKWGGSAAGAVEEKEVQEELCSSSSSEKWDEAGRKNQFSSSTG